MIQVRNKQKELMDQPNLDPIVHRHALRGLQRLNRISRSAAILWPPIAVAARGVETSTLRVLDLACGGGDNALAIAKLGRQAGLSVDVVGCDISQVAIDQAKFAAARRDLTDAVSFVQLNVLEDPLPAGFDVITCSLFLHHLSLEQAVALLGRMADSAKHWLVISDLRRTWRGLVLARAASRLLTTSPIVHTDAVLSVEGAFSEVEAADIASQAGLNGAVISMHWPQRWRLVWNKT